MRKKDLRRCIPKVPLLVAVLLFMLPLSNASALIIEDWTVDQVGGLQINWDGMTALPTSVQGSVPTGINAIGGERDIQTNLITGTQPGIASSKVELAAYIVGFETTLNGNSIVQWDGADGSPVLNPVGLGCVDLLAEGNSLTLTVISDDLPCTVVMNVYTDAANWSTHTFNLPGGVFAPTPYPVALPGGFAVGGGAGADFSCVGAITLQVTPDNPQIGALDMSLGPISIGCDKSCTCTLTAIPEAPFQGQNVTVDWCVNTFENALPAADGELTVMSDFGAAVPPLTPAKFDGECGQYVEVAPPAPQCKTYSLVGQNGCGDPCPCADEVCTQPCECPPVNSLSITPPSWSIGSPVHLCWDTTPFPFTPGWVNVDAPGYGPGVPLPEDGCIDFVADKLEYCVDSANGCPDAPECHLCKESQPIPTLSGLGIGILAVLMAGSALLLVRRKRSIG